MHVWLPLRDAGNHNPCARQGERWRATDPSDRSGTNHLAGGTANVATPDLGSMGRVAGDSYSSDADSSSAVASDDVIVSRARGFVFVHNPKVAGTSFRNAINAYHDHPTRFWGVLWGQRFGHNLDLAHLRNWELAVVAPDVLEMMPRCNSLAFVRPPVDRFYSACFTYFMLFRPDTHFQLQTSTNQAELIRALIRDGIREEQLRTDHRFVHFSPQSWFTHHEGQRVVRHVLPLGGRTDDFSKAFTLLGLPDSEAPTVNRAFGDLYRDTTDPEVTAFVRDFYAQDLALLGDLIAPPNP